MKRSYPTPTLFILALTFFWSSIAYAANPITPITPNFNIQDPGAITAVQAVLLGLPAAPTSCGPTDSNCYVDITNSFTTLTVSGNTTLGTGAGTTNTFGTGTGAVNTIGNATGSTTINGTVSTTGNTNLGNDPTDITTITGILNLLGATIQGALALVFEGATDDANETTFAITDPTADRIITFPDASGTVQLSGGSGSFSGIVNTGTLDQQGAISDSGGNVAINDDTDITGNLTVSGTTTATGLVTATAGVTTPANVTTTGTGDLVSGDDLTVADDATISDALAVVGATSLATGGGVTTTGGNLTVAGDVTVTGNDLTFGNGEGFSNQTNGILSTLLGAATDIFNVLTGNFKVGDGTPDTALNGEDAYIEGTLEVDGATRLDGALTANAGITTTTLSTTGNTTIGDAAGDTLTVNATTTFNVLPSFPLSSAFLFVGDGSNIAAAVALSGDATITNTGVLTIANDAITAAKILNGTITNADVADDALDFDKFADALTLDSVTTIATAGNSFSLTGTGAFSTSTGTNTLNGATSVSGTNTFTVGTGATTLGGTLAVTGDQTNTGDVAVNGGDITTTATTFNLLNTTATTLNIGGAATVLALGATTGTSTVNNALSVLGNTTLGDIAGDIITLNAQTVSLPNSLNFDSNTLFIDATNNRIGIGSGSPQQALDVVGGVGFRLGSDYATTGSQNDVNLGPGSSFRYTGAGTATFTGVLNGADGELLVLHNASASTLLLGNQDAGSAAINRIITGTGSDLAVAPNSTVSLQYDAQDSRWRVISGNGILTLNGLTGTSQTFATGTSGTDFNISPSGTTNTFNIPSASATNRGLVTTGAQSLAGDKTLTGSTTIGDATGDTTTINGSTLSIPNSLNIDTNTLFIDSSANRVAIGSGSSAGGVLFVDSGTLNSVLPVLGLNTIWNAVGTTMNVFQVDLNDVASNANSNFLNFKNGGSTVYRVQKDGSLVVGGSLSLTGVATLSLGADVNSNKITNLATPTVSTDATNKSYVDGLFATSVTYTGSVINFAAVSPGNVTDGNRYIDTANWSGCGINYIVTESGAGAYACTQAPTTNLVSNVTTLGENYVYNGTSWVSQGSNVAHNSTSSIQGGQASEYYHLKNSDYAALTAGTAQLTALQTGGSPSFVGLTTSGNSTFGDTSGDTLTLNSQSVAIPNSLNFDSNTLFIDAANDRVGIRTTSPTAPLAIVDIDNTTNQVVANLRGANGSFIGFTDVGSSDWGVGITDNSQALVFSQDKSPGAAGTERMRINTGGNVGIATTTTNTKLDVNGDLALRKGTDFTSTGTQNDVALGSFSTIRYTGTSSGTFTGIAGGFDGKLLFIHNDSGNSLTLANSNGGSSAVNQIVTGTGSDVTILNGSGATLQYDSGAGRWRIVGSPAVDTVAHSPLSGLTAATTTNSINNANFAQTWNWNTATTQTALTLQSDTLTSGSALSLASSATSFTGDLSKIELTGSNAGNTGNALKVGMTGASSTGTALNVTNAGTGFALRVNDDGTYTDTTSFVVDMDGNVGIGDSTPDATLDVDSSATTGQNFLITNTGAYTGTGVASIVANSATSGTVLNLAADALTSGIGLSLASASTALTGDLAKLETSGSNAGITGNVLKVGITGATGTGTALNVTNAGTGLALRINDDGTYTDTTPVVVNASGQVGIGTASPSVPLHVVTRSGKITGTVTSVGTAVTGVGTAFTTEVIAGDILQVGTLTATVSTVNSATSITLTSGFSYDVTVATNASINPATNIAQYVMAGGTSGLIVTANQGLTLQGDNTTAVLDTTNLLANANFASNDFTSWTAGANWAAGTGAAVYSGPGGAILNAASVKITNGGTGYTVGDVLTLPGGTGDAQITVSTVSAGKVITFTLTNAGTTYNDTITGTATGGTGSGFTFAVTQTVAGNTLTQTASPAMINNQNYQLTFVKSGSTQGAVTISLGGNTLLSAQKLANQTHTYTFTATGNAALTITPTADFNGTLDSFVLTHFENTSSPLITFKNAAGTTALEMRTNGVTNTAIGLNTGLRLTSGTNNSAVGWSALKSVTTGGSNSAFGAAALGSVVSGTSNSAFGVSALTNNTASNNSAFGVNSLLSNTTGGNNNAFGAASLQSNTTGTANNAFGTNALQNNTTGVSNSAFGQQSLFANITGANNSAFGMLALTANTTGSNNTAVGVQAMFANTTGSDNTAVGLQALSANTTGSFNVGIGELAMYGNATGSSNVAIGYRTFNAGTDIQNSVAVGYQAGPTVTTGINNTLIGHTTGSGITTGSANTVIGRAVAPGNVSNNVILGDGTGDIRLQISSAGDTTIDGCLNYNGGSLGTCLSDERLKKDVTAFNYSLSDLIGISTVTYRYNGLAETPKDSETTAPRIGFIAQQVQQVAPQFVNTVEAKLNPEDTSTTQLLQVNYNAITYAIINAVKEIATISGVFKEKLVAWLGDAANGLGRVRANELCAGNTCVTESQLAALLANVPNAPVPPPAAPTPDTEAPVMTLNGLSEQTVTVGEGWSDLGVTVTDNVGVVGDITATVNGGAPVALNLLTLDTSEATVYTIVYTAQDATNNTSTVTRTVTVIE